VIKLIFIAILVPLVRLAEWARSACGTALVWHRALRSQKMKLIQTESDKDFAETVWPAPRSSAMKTRDYGSEWTGSDF
jgi:hypothetical protein